MIFRPRAALLGAFIIGSIACSGTAPVEDSPAPTPALEWRAVEESGRHAPPTVEAPPTVQSREPATVAPANVFSDTTVVDARLMDAPAALVLKGFERVRLDDEGLKEASYPYPFAEAPAPLSNLYRRLITVDHETRVWDMRTGLLLPSGASLGWSLPSGIAGRVLHFSLAGFHSAFRGRKADKITVEVLVDSAVVATHEFSGEASSVAWEEGTAALDDAAAAVTFRISSPEGGGLKPGVGLADVHLTAPASQAEDAPARLHPGPNVVVIFVDALRSDCAGPGNPGFPSVSPYLDSQAATGTSYTDNFSVSNQTRPSIVGFLQSQHPTVGRFHAKWWNIRKEKIEAYYARKPPLLPLLLSRAGYETVTFGRNHFQFGTTLLGLDPGFDRIWDNRKSVEDTERIMDRAIAWLDGNRDRKFMMLVNISPPHQPYKAPEEHEAWTKARLADYEGHLPARKDYLAEVRYADVAIERLVGHMDSLGLRDRTLFLVTADHGEVMRTEHSCRSELFETICHNSHGLTLYDEELNVPLIWWGWGVKPGMVHGHTVTHLDVAPTILDAVGLPPHPAHTGLTRWSELRGDESAAERPDVVYVETRLASGLRAWGWKYILHHQKDDARTPAWNSGGEVTHEELYDLTKDPHETRNLVRRQEPRRKQLRQVLRDTRALYTDYVEQAWQAEWDPDSSAHPRPPVTPPIPGVEPVAAVPGGTTEQGTAAGHSAYHMAFSGEGPTPRGFEGVIRVEGRVVDARYLGPARGFSLLTEGDGIQVNLDVAPGAEVLLSFRTLPADAAVSLELNADGAALSRSRIYAGRDGLAILDRSGWTTDEAVSLLHSVRGPHRIPGEDLGVFVWRTGPGRVSEAGEFFDDGDLQKERIVDPATRGILKDYGYWN